MKTAIIGITAFILTCAPSVITQAAGPINPEDTGLIVPKTETFYINVPPDNINNGKLESLGVQIANNGNVLVGWEDDSSGIQDLEAVWMLFDPTGKTLNTDALIKSVDGTSVTTKYRAFFRKDGSPVAGYTAWGPKIKANLFGDGIGMGATGSDVGLEVPEFAAFKDTGDFPVVQLLTNDGKPVSILAGVTSAYAADAGNKNIRIGDWEYLSNGNVVIVGESRQGDDLVNIYKGAAAGNHAIYRIVDQTGKEIHAAGLVSATTDANEIWHGVGVTKNGFAVRFGQGGRAQVRLFDNAGVPTVSTNIDIGKVAGKEIAAGGGRGDGTGFHGNGNDAYVSITSGTDDTGKKQAWVTVLNANGTLRYSRAVADDLTLAGPDRVDAAIDPSGRVFAVFDDAGPQTANGNKLVMGRILDETGKPVGGTFYVSEKETAATAGQKSERARVAWRGGLAVVIWQSNNDPDAVEAVVGARLFSTFTPGSVESVGLKRIVADTPIINPGINSLDNWEPYPSVLGNSVFLIEGNTFADGTTDAQRYVVALQPVDGKPMKLGEGFYDDSGKPFKAQINLSRQNGNPGRVAGDRRPGAVNFMVGAEASPHELPEFQSDNRWKLGFDRLSDGRYGTIQTFSLDTATLTQKPLMKAIDAVNGRLTSGAAAGNQISRFGGDVAGLDNGNFVAAVDDRSQVRDPANITTAVIVAPDGKIVKDSFIVDKQDIWSNVTSYKGGFAIRVHSNIFFYDNDGTLKGKVDQSTSGASFDAGRGDGTRIAGHINSPFVFLAGRATGGNIVKLAVFDSRDQKFVTVADVSEPAFAGDFDRVTVASDALNRIVVAWVSKPVGYEKEQVAARVLAFDESKKAITPLTKSFFAFLNTAKVGVRSLQMGAAMTTKQILIAAKGEINLKNKPDLGTDSPTQLNFYTVISHPDPKDDPTTPAGGGTVATAIKINFQAATAVVPAGYLADVGKVFGDRGNGYKYGWDVDNTANARERNSANSPSKLYDTFNHMQKPLPAGRVWEIEVPNGRYSVHAASGDPDNFDSVFDLLVEGVTVIKKTPTTTSRFADGTGTVTVSDGRMTFSNGPTASNNKISFTEITPLGPDVTKPTFAKPSLNGKAVTITWTGGGKLQESASVTGPWIDVTGSPSGTFTVQTTAGPIKFYRVVGP